MKIIVKIVLISYSIYFIIAIALGLAGVINYIPLAPGWGIKTPNYVSENKKKIVSFEQPIVYYKNNSIEILSIEKEQEAFVKRKTTYQLDEKIDITIKYQEIKFKVPIKQNHSVENDNYTLPSKIIAISDIEGNFDGFVQFLKGNNIINDKFEWSFGNGHLVLVGDFFDRGKYVNECLWLIYKLEKEAEKTSGKVHFILGNHEVMNLVGAKYKKSFKYVNGKFFANAEFLGFNYGNWYTKDTELGRWLRTKNSIEKIGNYLFVHAGISTELANSELNINEINAQIRNGLDKSPEEHSDIDKLLIRNNGPLWYRGLATGEVSDQELSDILKVYNSEKIIIGHTIVNEITSLYDDRVIDIDLKHTENGHVFGLLIEGSDFFQIDDEGRVTEIN